MKKYYLHYLVLFFIIALLFADKASGKSDSASARKIKIEILYTQNTNGVLENCDCPGSPLGGLDKRLTLMKRLADRDSVPALYLDGGDILSSKGFPAKDRFVLRAYAMIQYDAIGVGDQEFINGTEFLRDQNNHLHLPFISSFMTAKSGVLPKIQEIIIKQVKGIRFGIISLINKEPFDLMDPEKVSGVIIADYLKSLPSLIKKVRKESDIVVVLSHLGYSEDIKIAKKNLDIDVIIGAHTQNVLSSPERYGETIIVQAGKNTEFVGQLSLEIDVKSKKIVDMSGQIHPVLKDIPGDSLLQGLIAHYQRVIASDFKEKTDSTVLLLPPEYSFIENQKCINCHKYQGSVFGKDPHSCSYESLLLVNSGDRAECLSCHKTDKGHFQTHFNESSSEQAAGFGCVECHYTKKEHLEGKKATVQPITEQTCVRCHNQEINPTFNFASSLTKMNHRMKIMDEYIVQRGDYLSKIASFLYRDMLKWRRIYNLNKKIINDPNLIYPNQKLRVDVDR